MDSMILFAVVMLIVVCGLIGRHIGFVKMILSMAATVVALIIAGVLTPPICQVVKNNMGILDDIKVKVEESIKEAGIEEDYIEELKIPRVIKDKINENIDKEEISENEYVVEKIATLALSSVVFIIIFAIVIVILGVAISMLDIVAHLPIIASANRGAGLVAGLIYGVVVVWICMIVLTAMSSTNLANDILLVIGRNKILSTIYDINPLMDIVIKVIDKI